MAMCLVRQSVRRACAQCFGSHRALHSSPALRKIVQYKLSDIGEGIREVTVKSWFVKLDDTVSQFDNICEVESDKAAVTITSRYDGKVKKLYHDVGEIALVGQPLVDIDVEDEDSSESDVEVKTEGSSRSDEVKSSVVDKPSESVQETWNKSLATPAVRRIAMENKIKISDVKGSGKQGRVMKEDILDYLSKKDVKTISKVAEKSVPLSTIQKVMTRTMTDSQSIPAFLYCDEINVTKLVQLRKDVKNAVEKNGIKLSYLPFFLKAVSKSLSEYPILNASIDESLQNIIYKSSHNIGVAVDSPAGLVVPNIKDLQNLTIVQIAKEINRLQEAAKAGKLTPNELNGGTFSVSNVGSIGGTYASPMILSKEVCIIALGRIQTLPRFDSQGHVIPSDILYISISADHRVIDGATVARFSNLWKSYIENPSTLLLDL